MQAISMRVPHFQQSSPGACLPACVRMVLAARGDRRSEAELAALLGSYAYGTPASRVTRVKQLGYAVEYGSVALAQLRAAVAGGQPAIVFASAEWLPQLDFDGFHAFVLTAVSDQQVTLLDPACVNGPTRLSVDAFLLAWEEFDSRAAVIQ